MNSRVAKIEISEKINWPKIGHDITILKNLRQFTYENNWRSVVSGGYGLDLFLSLTTRTHNDIDVVIYGQEDREEAIKKLNRFIVNTISHPDSHASHETFYMELDVNAPGFGANLYFVETIEKPFVNYNIVKKFDGSVEVNPESKSPRPRLGKMGKFEVEIQDQNAHLADILKKSSKSSPTSKYDQDIQNLRHITDPKVVEFLQN